MDQPQTIPPITSPAQETPEDATVNDTPPHNTNRLKLIFIVFFIIFLLTIGSAGAVYFYKDVIRSQENLQTPTTTPLPSVQTQNNCVVGGCSGQFCLSQEESEGVVSTCEWTQAYACYQTAECKTQADGACGWTMTEELTSCLENPPSL